MPDVWFRTLDNALLRCAVPERCTAEQLSEALGQRVGDTRMPGVRFFTRGEQIKPQQAVTLEAGQVILVVLSLENMIKETLEGSFDRPPYLDAAKSNGCVDELVGTCSRTLEGLRERLEACISSGGDSSAALANLTGACTYFTAMLSSIVTTGDDASASAAAAAALSANGHLSDNGEDYFVDMSSGVPRIVIHGRAPREVPRGNAVGISERLGLLMEAVEDARERRGIQARAQQAPRQLPEVPDAFVEQLVGVLGCEEERARRALQLTRCNLDDALNLLLDGDPRLASDEAVLGALGGGGGDGDGDGDGVDSEIRQALQFMSRHPEAHQILLHPRLDEALGAVGSDAEVGDDPELSELVQSINNIIRSA